MKDYKKEFIKLFNNTAHNLNRYEVFNDFVKISAIALYNSFARNQELENEYLRIINKYKKEDQNKLTELFSFVVMGLEVELCDFMGSIFMELELGSSQMGQFFTPYSISKVTAELTYSDNLLKNKDFITLHEPASGSGGLIIAFADVMLSKGINYQQKLFVSSIDKDTTAFYMCYIQLALLNIPAEVILGNALTMQLNQVFRTPAYYIGFWNLKLNKPKKQLMKTTIKVELSSYKD